MNTLTLPQQTVRKADERTQGVLVVSDHGPLSNLIWCQLSALGYRVLTASWGGEAQDVLLAPTAVGIDLLILDLHVPIIRGDEIVKWFQRENPAGKVLLMAGHDVARELGRNVGVLHMPLQIETLGERVQEFLGGGVPRQNAA